MTSIRTTTPTRITLCAKDPLPLLTRDPQVPTPPLPRATIYRVSLLHNPATCFSREEIKKAFAVRRKYRADVAASEASHEIAVFEASQASKSSPPLPPPVPIPSDLNLDLIRANEPSSAVRMYCVPEHRSASQLQPSDPLLSQMLPTKPRLGTSHWQVLDEPLLPCRGPTTYSRSHKARAFYVPIRQNEKSGIRLIVDDLVEMRNRRSVIYQKALLNRIERENQKSRKELREKYIATRESTRRRKQDVLELANRSGQLNAQSLLSDRQSTRRFNSWTGKEATPDEAAALAELAKYDDMLWVQAQQQKKARKNPAYLADGDGQDD
jgi:hypothetical protein